MSETTSTPAEWMQKAAEFERMGRRDMARKCQRWAKEAAALLAKQA